MRKLIKYLDFESALAEAQKKAQIKLFISRLEVLLDQNLNIYFANLFLARSFNLLGEIKTAEEFYLKAIQLAHEPDKIKLEYEYFLKSKESITPLDASIFFTEALKNEDEIEKLKIFEKIYSTSTLRSEIFLHQYILTLQRLKYFERAKIILSEIFSEINSDELEAKFLLVKAQLHSAEGDLTAAANSYIELITKKRQTNAKDSHLAHLEFELSRLYARIGKFSESLDAAERAYQLTPVDSILQFINTLQGTDITQIDIDDFKLEITDEQIDFVSPMLKFDIEDFDYRDEIILAKNQPALEDANRLYRKAARHPSKDKSLVYPIYLEAAKAFYDLKMVDVDNLAFTNSLAQYSALKSNTIFYHYRLELFSERPNQIKLKRLKDSACSYIEASLNVVLEGKLEKVLLLLENYLKIIISYELLQNDRADYKDIVNIKSFNSVIAYTLKNKNVDIVLRTYETIIHFGSVSSRIWDKISRKNAGTEEFYKHLIHISQTNNKKSLINLLTSTENISIDSTLSVGKIFQRFVNSRKDSKEKFENDIQQFRKISLNPKSIDQVVEKWNIIKNEYKLFTETDLEIASQLEKILRSFGPYLERTIPERTNILYEVRTIIDKELLFIVDNTTYWGRAFFFPLLKKWRIEIDKIEKERVSQTIPILRAYADPSYVYLKEDRYFLNLLIKNEGQSTAVGYQLQLNAFKLDGTAINEVQEHFDVEISVGGIGTLEIELASELLVDEKAIKLFVKINPYYQDRELQQEGVEFTLEKEDSTFLEIHDIPWNETRIPKEHLFKGREKLIELLLKHYKSFNRDQTYILYGLTRTGKSSVLKYLEKTIDKQHIIVDNKQKTIITFFWDLSEASGQSNSQDLWAFLLYDSTIAKLEKLENGNFVLPKTSSKPRFKDWKNIITYLNDNNYYPFFLIDEFAYFKLLHDNNRVDQSFLAAIRQYALNGLSSFIFAGTYDLKELIKNPQYGITGQLTNTIEKLISNIEQQPAYDLINVIEDKLSFTKEAKEHILFLSGRVPYFIQIICKNCGYYAVDNKRKIIGYPEVELVSKVLAGEHKFAEDSLVTILSAGTFQNNQYSPTDIKEVNALISSMCYFNRDKVIPRGVGYAEMQELWSRRQIRGFAPKLAEALEYLKDKEIIEEKADEKVAVYFFKVDLFRRWWENHHKDIELELDILKEKL